MSTIDFQPINTPDQNMKNKIVLLGTACFLSVYYLEEYTW